ncbi:MAG: Lrp/AsnC family transcriptional regulator [Gammaproteobacteria bacterium]|nr:Lrp/AsnC family transcriptional regulator [Gammaproteobacteria bacterium]
MLVDDKDKELIDLLQKNSRESTAKLARVLNLSRTTVSSRIERLEKKGIIQGYTVKFSPDYELTQVRAHVMISSDPKHSANIVTKLRNIGAVKALHAVNGVYEMLALISAESTESLDSVLDEIGNTEGINKTTSSIILSTKFNR